MNGGLLLDALSKIGDHPAHVREVRKIVVALAVAGKLGGSSHTSRGDYPTVNAEDLPADFNDPAAFTRLGAIARIEKGKTGIKQTHPGPFPMVVTGENRITCDHYDFEEPAAIVPLVSSAGHGKASLNRLHYQEGRFALGTILAAILPHDPQLISARFIFEYLSAFKDELLVSRMIGTANVSLSIGKVAEVPIPLVRPEVQRRVDELMALCDRLEAARLQREVTRDRLAAASLARLNTPEPPASPDGVASNESSFQADARFAIGTALPALTTRPDQIKQLRQTILSLAVRGRLVHQDRSDEPAELLLAEVSRQRSAILEAALPNADEARAQMKKQANQAIPAGLAELPAGWVWATLMQCSALVIDCRNKTAPQKSSGVRLVRTTNIRDGQLNNLDPRYVDQATYELWSSRAYPQAGDILITREAPMGEVCLIPSDTQICLGQRIMLARLIANTIDPQFLIYSLRDPHLMDRVQDKPIGSTVQHLRVGGVETLLVPLPPRREQSRIVAKINELMAFCDQLEVSLTHGEKTRGHLLDALLHEALLPRSDKVIDFVAVRQRLLERRESVACRVVQKLGPTRGFGRVRAVKPLYWAETHCGVALGGQWGRAEAGPFDQWIYNFEAHAASAGWFSVVEHLRGDKVMKAEYQAGPGLSAKAEVAAEALGVAAPEFERVLSLLADLDTEESEIVTTLYAAWNDLLLEGKAVSDAAVITEVREHWHPSKSRFTPAHLQIWLEWLRENRLVPKGQGPNTRHQQELI